MNVMASSGRGRSRVVATVIASIVCLLVGGCGGAKNPPTQRDVNVVAAAMADIVYQCQSVAAGYLSSADSAGLRRDVNALLDAYHRLRADATIPIGARHRLTLRRELVLAQTILRQSGCSEGQAGRIAAAVGHH